MGTSLVTEICGILVSGITTLGQGLASAINNLLKALFIDNTGTTAKLSDAGNIIVVFAAVSLAISFTTFLVKYIFSLGARK